MDSLTQEFLKRWDVVERETLSSVRRQVELPVFDISQVNLDFRRACGEWFDGKLAPRVWYTKFVETNPHDAYVFKNKVENMKLSEVEFSKPPQIISPIATITSLPVCYFMLDRFSEMGILSKSIFTIGIGVLVWYAVQSYIKGKKTSIEDQVVESYKLQLETLCVELKSTLPL